ncbi:hypothetical protein HYR69_06170 [Candidatus Sumerlaeota bacterium]|nr:hypothetical protein [Candidatus Sumerlaeota bacterium]MBI3736574.1 hypothetical protein [Candidatus Sumerlaeota bacterium]
MTAPRCLAASLFSIALLACGCALFSRGQADYENDPRHAATFAAGDLSGRILDNLANAAGQGAGFHPLTHNLYPDKPIFRPEMTGLNFEHIFNGVAADKERSMFTPRKDLCELSAESPARVSLYWPANKSSWGTECKMTYTIPSPNAIDLTFEGTPTKAEFPLGYAALMWASYMNRTRERQIHFVGRDGDREGWIVFGDDQPGGIEMGTVSYAGVSDLPYEEGAQTLNLIEGKTKKFTKPFFYGLLDGDNDLATENDTLVYIMMFDQTEPIRFAMWNFITDSIGKPDPHSPAWDWQFVIRDPKPGQTYRYRARVVIKPFAGDADVEREYENWRSSLP